MSHVVLISIFPRSPPSASYKTLGVISVTSEPILMILVSILQFLGCAYSIVDVFRMVAGQGHVVQPKVFLIKKHFIFISDVHYFLSTSHRNGDRSLFLDLKTTLGDIETLSRSFSRSKECQKYLRLVRYVCMLMLICIYLSSRSVGEDA